MHLYNAVEADAAIRVAGFFIVTFTTRHSLASLTGTRRNATEVVFP